MADIGLSAFSLFFMQSESFLDYQRGLETKHMASNCQTLFGMAKIPTDNRIRSMLDPFDPAHLQPCFDATIDIMRQRGGLEGFQRLGGRTLVAPRQSTCFAPGRHRVFLLAEAGLLQLPDAQACQRQA